MLGSCDKHLSFSRAAKNFTICQGGHGEEGGAASHPSPWQTTQEEKNREGDAERKTDSGKERERERLKEGKKKSVIHSNTSSSLFAGLSLATGASTGPLQRDGFVIRVFPLPADSCPLRPAAN